MGMLLHSAKAAIAGPTVRPPRGRAGAVAACARRGEAAGGAQPPAMPAALSAPLAALAAGVCLMGAPAAMAQDAALMPGFSGVDDSASDLVQGLLAKSRENKASNDQNRIDRYYKREFMINRLTGSEVLGEPCDPRDPEFGADPKCVKLPRLPQDRMGATVKVPEYTTEDFARIDGRARFQPPLPSEEQ